MKGHYSNILVPIDFSEQSLLALEQAYALAKLLNAEITLLYVIPEGGNNFAFGLFTREPSEQQKAEYKESCYARILKISENASRNSWIKVNPLLLSGKVHEVILNTSKDMYARFIVMATNSMDIDKKQYYIGSVTSHILKEAQCPVLTFNGTNIREHFDTIILPLDLTKQTQQKVSKAVEIAKYYNSTIRIVSVLMTDEADIVDHINEQMKEVKAFIENRDIYTTARIIYGEKVLGSLTSYILDYAYQNDGDLIMVMTRQDIGIRDKLLRSNAADIFIMSKIPVLSIVPKEI